MVPLFPACTVVHVLSACLLELVLCYVYKINNNAIGICGCEYHTLIHTLEYMIFLISTCANSSLIK